ncbi:MAG: acyltransferase [Bradymonadales bacterium]|nr:acyltransferase [Bradymonadales bacterium]
MIQRRSHGNGTFTLADFQALGPDTVIEPTVLVFHPETISLGKGVYVGHQTILKGYFDSSMHIGDGSWIGQQCFFHSAGNITIGRQVGIGPAVKILTSQHRDAGREIPLLLSPITRAPVVIEDGADIGIGAVILPGVHIGRGVIVGAGAVVTRDLPDWAVATGVPARVTRLRNP